VLEPNANPAGKIFQEALFAQRIPATAFEVSDIADEHARLSALGVTFQCATKRMGPGTVAVLSDTCGNWIQLWRGRSVVFAPAAIQSRTACRALSEHAARRHWWCVRSRGVRDGSRHPGWSLRDGSFFDGGVVDSGA